MPPRRPRLLALAACAFALWSVCACESGDDTGDAVVGARDTTSDARTGADVAARDGDADGRGDVCDDSSDNASTLHRVWVR